VRAKYQKLILSANGYGPALAQQDRRIEELESKCERLIFSCERTESERDEAKRARDAAKAEAERLAAKLIQSMVLSSPDAMIRTPAPSKEGDGE
jgi:septal ring factor EnvC (AmiA/AmiB activator)